MLAFVSELAEITKYSVVPSKLGRGAGCCSSDMPGLLDGFKVCAHAQRGAD